MSGKPRIRPSGVADEVFMFASMIKDIPRDVRTDAIAAFLGHCEDRIIHAIKKWKDGEYDYFFIPGLGIDKDSEGRALTLGRLASPPFNLPEHLENVIVSEKSDNTATDAAWTAEQVVKYNIRSLTITTNGNHLTRSYLTMLKALQRVNRRIVLIPEPTPMNTLGSKGLIRSSELHTGEFDRIVEYQARPESDLVSREEFLQYIQWLYDALGGGAKGY